MDTDDNDVASSEDITTYHYIGHGSDQKHEWFQTYLTNKDRNKMSKNLQCIYSWNTWT